MMSEPDLVEIVQIAVADLNHEENDAGKKSFFIYFHRYYTGHFL